MVNICWLKITDYIRGWARITLGSSLCVREEPVLIVTQLPGAQEALLLGTVDRLPKSKLGNAISATWMNALEAGIAIDPVGVQLEYGIGADTLCQYLPIACPANAFSEDGTLRPWTHETAFGERQSVVMQRVIRESFWTAVRQFSEKYARLRNGESYAQIEMIEAFCKHAHTDDIYAEAIRREWQRRLKKHK